MFASPFLFCGRAFSAWRPRTCSRNWPLRSATSSYAARGRASTVHAVIARAVNPHSPGSSATACPPKNPPSDSTPRRVSSP